MILTDTGPLVALLDADDSQHQACISALRNLPPEPLLTTWPCFTEAMYLLGAVGGYRYQAVLWRLRHDERLFLQDLGSSEIERMAVLMEKYQDLPMDMADASLVAVAERLSTRQVFTLDGDFHVYRLKNGAALQLVP